MFFTIWTVTKFEYDRAIWAAYFMDEKDAMRFAKSEVKKEEKEWGESFPRSTSTDYGGSKMTIWTNCDVDITVDNNCWVEGNTPVRLNLELHPWSKIFENIDALKAWCKESQQKVINNK